MGTDRRPSSAPSPPGPAPEAVLFDMDGTLVDTEPYWIAAEYRLVESFGGSWSQEHAHALVGNALLTSGAYLRDHGGVPLEPAEIVERLQREVIAAVRVSMPWRPGALALLAELRAGGVPCAMVTMSYAQLAEEVIAALPPDTFATLVSGDQVADGKPHPEAYLTAAARLGLDPRRCVAIEDSPTGIASAEAAGCIVVAVPHHVPIASAPTRHLVASLTGLDLAELRRLAARA